LSVFHRQKIDYRPNHQTLFLIDAFLGKNGQTLYIYILYRKHYTGIPNIEYHLGNIELISIAFFKGLQIVLFFQLTKCISCFAYSYILLPWFI